jgi:serine/threonine protein kinase
VLEVPRAAHVSSGPCELETQRMDSLSSQALGDEELIAGRYRITSLLGRGGMGIVHGAIDELTGQRVAIKRTLPDASSKTLELFKREFHTLHGLRP